MVLPSPAPSFYGNPTDQPTQNPQWHLMLLCESLSFTQYSTQIFNNTVSDSLWAHKNTISDFVANPTYEHTL